MAARTTHTGDGVGLLLARLGARADAELAELVIPLGLTPALVEAIGLLDRHPGTPQREMSGVFAEMKERGLAVRRRDALTHQFGIHLTDRGHELARDLVDVMHDLDLRFTAGMTSTNAQMLRQLLSVVAGRLGIDG